MDRSDPTAPAGAYTAQLVRAQDVLPGTQVWPCHPGYEDSWTVTEVKCWQDANGRQCVTWVMKDGRNIRDLWRGEQVSCRIVQPAAATT